MKFILPLLVLGLSLQAFSKTKKINYKYKKFERFDFDALDVQGSRSNPGDLSIAPRFNPKFKNKIPERENFNRQMKAAIDSIL